MRTTLVIDDDVFALAKQQAALRGETLSALVSAALRESFREPKPGAQTREFVMPVFGVAGEPVARTVEEIALLRDEGF
jgi:hypothetical protein